MSAFDIQLPTMSELDSETEKTRQQAIDDERRNNAYNALTKIYGPVAGDPVAAAQMQEVQQRSAMNPLLVQEQQDKNKAAELTNTDTEGQQRRSAVVRATGLLKATANPDGSVNPDTFDRFIAPNANVLGITPEQLPQVKSLLTGPDGSKHLDDIANAMMAGSKIKGVAAYGQDANGNPVALETDAYGNVRQVPLNGTVPTVVSNARTAQTRAVTGQKNASTNAYNASVKGNNSEFGAGPDAPAPGAVAPASNAGQYNAANVAKAQKLLDKYKGNDAAAIQNAPDDATAIAVTDLAASRNAAAGAKQKTFVDSLPPKGRQVAVGQAQQIANQSTNLRNTNSILDQVDKQITPYATGAGSLLKSLPGTTAANLKANLDTLSAMGLTTWINSLKNAQGQTGIGRVLQSEANAASKLFGNMEQDQTADQLAYHARLFRQTVNELYSHARAAYKAQWRSDPETVLGIQPEQPGKGGNLPGGWKYLGPVK